LNRFETIEISQLFSSNLSCIHELIQLSSGDNDHLRDLSQIQFLVLDEADRMTQEHSFPQLVKILDMVNEANPSEEDDGEDEDEASDEESDDGSRMLGLPGIRGEAKLTMLTDDILKQLETQKSSTKPEAIELADDEYSNIGDDEFDGIKGDIPEDLFATPEPRVHRQTFVYSATLTLPFTSTVTSKPKRKKKRKKLGLDGGIAEILEKTNAMGETKVVDLSSSSPASSSLANYKKSNGVRLPPGLSLEQIKCTQRHKDSHLYAYLMTTQQGSSGPCLVFCNSIAAVRRVGSTFQTLGFNVRILHAQMQQVSSSSCLKSWGMTLLCYVKGRDEILIST
jgi:ATP-dependent RNA helicase DDX24/MAK5